MVDGTLYASPGSGINEYLPGGSSPIITINAFGLIGFGIAVGPLATLLICRLAFPRRKVRQKIAS